jgi:hypothetical protein
MADEQKETSPMDPVIRPFIDFWTNYFNQVNDSTRAMLDYFNGNADAKTWQRRWLDAVAQSADAYLRSPVFLEAMKQNTDAMIKAKQHIDDLATEIARNANIPTAGDISGLYERLHTHEHEILSRLKRIEERLAAIEQHVGAGQTVGST